MSTPEAGGRVRRSLLLALALLVATVGIGAVVRRAQSASGVTGTTAAAAGPLAFEAPARNGIHFGGHLDRGAIQTNGDGLVRLELSLRADAERAAAAVRVPSDIVVVLDRSGSMSGDKLGNARASIRALLDRLGPQDRFALVTYSDDAELRLALAPATPAARAAWMATVEGIPAQGGTNMAAGLEVGLATIDAARAAGRAPRVILISDGLANQGDVSREGLRGRASRAARGEYALSTVGVGTDFDEDLMASLADAGSGNFHYVENAVNLSEIFSSELATAQETVASGVEIRFAPASGVELVEAAGYPIERGSDGAYVLRPGTLFAGQDRRIWTTLRVSPTGPSTQTLGEFSVAYRKGDLVSRLAFPEAPRVTRVARDDDFYAQLDRKRWSSGVVVDAYNRLQREVASDVKAGQPAAAQAKIEAYRDSIGKMNARVASPEVSQKLDAMKDLEEKVQAAALAPTPERDRTAKELQASAINAARPGAKK
jgi:Ca-activated chloride channel family protein